MVILIGDNITHQVTSSHKWELRERLPFLEGHGGQGAQIPAFRLVGMLEQLDQDNVKGSSYLRLRSLSLSLSPPAAPQGAEKRSR